MTTQDPDLTCTFDEFKQRCKELIDAAPELDEAGLQNGIKMLNISYLTCAPEPHEVRSAALALQLTLRQVGAFA